MQIDAIGAQLTSKESALSSANTLGQEEFLKLFLTELNFQDPLEPMDNKEFISQLAQFSTLEQSRTMGESLDNIVLLNSTTQSLGLLGKQVELHGGRAFGEVTAVTFSENGPLLTLKTSDEGFLNNIRLAEVRLLRN